MAAVEANPAETLSSLQSSLAALQTSLAPILSTPLATLLANEADPLKRAKLQVLVGYVVHDLIWISLKTSGVEPDSHPVMAEIERLKSYFDKIKNASNVLAGIVPSNGPRTKLDTGAASRFINAAIGSKRSRIDPAYTPAGAEESGKHTRFDSGTEEAVDKLLNEESSAEDGDEEQDGSDSEVQESLVVTAPKADMKGKGKRPVMDPFAGYDRTPARSTSSDKASSKASKFKPSTSPKKGNKKRPSPTEDESTPATSASASAHEQSSAKSKRQLKKQKKARLAEAMNVAVEDS